MIENRINYIVSWMKDYLEKSGSKGFALGVSGGIDSALLALLLKKYFPDNYSTYFIDVNSSKEDFKYASLLFKKPGFVYEIIDLNKSFNLLKKELKLNEKNQANVKSRLRMVSLYAKAQEKNYLVLGTTNYIEYKIGYFTKYGDGASDLAPLANFLKREIKEMAIYLGVPKEIIKRAPSAGLYENQTDEEEIGLSYKVMDDYFSDINVSIEDKNKIELKILKSSHKRELISYPFFDRKREKNEK
ncbi:MAG: NAD(+) synthase [Mycoplasmoidaceae bacterium]